MQTRTGEQITFLFLYEHLKLGGIEKTIIDQIKVYTTMGIRIVWLRYGKKEDIYEPWKNLIKDSNLEIIDVNIRKKRWIDKNQLELDPHEKVYAVSYEPADFIRLEELAKLYANDFFLFYQVPHFKGRINYLEEFYFSGLQRKRIQNKLSGIYQKWYQNGNILFFSYKHIEEMNKRYNIDCLQRRDLIFQTPIKPEEFDYQMAKKRAKREEFRIVTCGRFEFPHKGYMFGLIDAYCRLKDKYPQLKLDIIGYGVCENQIHSYVEKLNTNYAKDITFLGSVSPDEVSYYFRRSHMNVSVAYSLLDGAKNGVVSLPAKHYTYDCQVYGYLSEEIGNYLDNREGESVDKYIEELINLSEEEYISLCKKSYSYAVDNLEYDPYWLFKKSNTVKNYYNSDEIRYIRRIEKHNILKAKAIQFTITSLRKIGLYSLVKKLVEKIRTNVK